MNTSAPGWDWIVRIFHWGVATAFLLNFFVTEEGGNWHEWIGYVAMTLLAIRILWGFVGPENARFVSFFPTPSRIRHHIDELRTGALPSEVGHNPLGGAMILVIMALLLGLGISGFLMEEVDYFWGEDWLEELHEVMANLLMLAVIVHVGAVVVIQHFFGHDLIGPMTRGRRVTKE